MGLPKGFDGGEVGGYFREGKIKEVADYCETDVVGTYQVRLRYELFRGTLSQNAFERSQQNLAEFPRQRAEESRCAVCAEKWPEAQAEEVAGVHVFSSQEGAETIPPRRGSFFYLAVGGGPPEIPNANIVSAPPRRAHGRPPDAARRGH
jgi:hypothetical protein